MPGEPEGGPQELTPEQAAAATAEFLRKLDDNDQALPENLPLAPLYTFWSLQNIEVSPGQAGVIVTILNDALPRGVPFFLSTERGLKFCSQLRKRLQTGPDLTVARSRLLIPR